METTDDTADQTAGQSAATPPRAIPPLPGGGSWRFDETVWKWISNDPAPAAEQSTDEV